MNLFDILTNISSTNKDISDSAEFEKVYQPYIINRFLASSSGCIMYVEDVNRMSHLPKRLQYLYLLYSIKNKRRRFIYDKKEVHADKAIMKYFRCREELALTYRKFLSDNDIEKMKRIFGMK
jgi:hypothetical protein